jgi:hypothetical protein
VLSVLSNSNSKIYFMRFPDKSLQQYLYEKIKCEASTYVCWTEEKSNMTVSSSVMKVRHMCGFSRVKGVLWDEGSKRQDGLVGHGTGVGESSHPYTKG